MNDRNGILNTEEINPVWVIGLHRPVDLSCTGAEAIAFEPVGRLENIHLICREGKGEADMVITNQRIKAVIMTALKRGHNQLMMNLRVRFEDDTS